MAARTTIEITGTTGAQKARFTRAAKFFAKSLGIKGVHIIIKFVDSAQLPKALGTCHWMDDKGDWCWDSKRQVITMRRDNYDALRTLAHEMVHCYQMQSGQLRIKFTKGPRGGKSEWRRVWEGKVQAQREWSKREEEKDAMAQETPLRDAFLAHEAKPATTSAASNATIAKLTNAILASNGTLTAADFVAFGLGKSYAKVRSSDWREGGYYHAAVVAAGYSTGTTAKGIVRFAA